MLFQRHFRVEGCDHIGQRWQCPLWAMIAAKALAWLMPRLERMSFRVATLAATQVYGCRCGKVHVGSYGCNDFLRCVCKHQTLWWVDQEDGELMCADCALSMWIVGSYDAPLLRPLGRLIIEEAEGWRCPQCLYFHRADITLETPPAACEDCGVEFATGFLRT